MNTQAHRPATPAFALVLGLVLAHSSLHAQSDAADAAATPPTTQAESDVVVTARKREESLREVPAAVTVIDGATLQSRRLDTLDDLGAAVTNLQFSDANGIRTVYLRGVGGGGRQAGFDPRVGVFLDGVYLGQPPSVNAVLLDLERVEVLRGPQSTFLGQNTVSGALSLITRAPSSERGLRLLAETGTDQIRRAGVAADLPLIRDVLLLRASGSTAHRGGFVTNRFDGDELDGGNDEAGRVQLRGFAGEEWVLDLAADSARQRSEFPTGEARSSTFGNAPAAEPAPYSANFDTAQADVNQNRGVSLRTSWTRGEWAFSSIGALRHAERHWVADFDYSPQNIIFLDYVDRYRVASQELRLTRAQPDARRHALIGAYVFDQAAHSDRRVDSGTQARSFIPVLGADDRLETDPRIDTRSYALFASFSQGFGERLTLDLGARGTRTFKDLKYDQRASPGFMRLGLITLTGHDDRIDETAWTPEANLRLLLTPQAMAYARFARGSKSGGFDADTLTRTQVLPARFGEERSRNFEIGTRTDWINGTLLADLSVFLADYTDYQITQFLADGGVNIPRLTSAGEVRTWGPELSLRWSGFPGLSLQTEAAWLHAEYEEFRNADGAGADYTGNRVEFAPKWNVVTRASYRRPLPAASPLELIVDLDHAWRSDFFTQPSNASRLHADPRRLLGARLGVGEPGGRWTLSVYGDNLLDDRYSESLNIGTLGTLYGRYGPPLTVGVQLQMNL